MTSENINIGATYYLPTPAITTADLTDGTTLDGVITGPDNMYLNATNYSKTYDFLATATVMIGATTITTPETEFTFYIPDQNTYLTSPN